MNSMTGYGKGVAEIDGRKLTIELKSVNHRFLDVSVKMPKIFNFAEDSIRHTLKDRFQRGHIDVYMNYEDLRADRSTLYVDMELVKKYADVSRNISGEICVENNVNVYELMRMPDVITVCLLSCNRRIELSAID